MGVRKRFTEAEDNYLRENVGKQSLAELASGLDRPRSSVQWRLKKLGLSASGATYEVPRVKEVLERSPDRLHRLNALRDLMEYDIVNELVPMMQRPAYYREYRALLAEIAELEGGADESSEAVPQSTLTQALAQLAEQQRSLLEQAADT